MKKRKLIDFACAAIMVVTLAACGNSSKKATNLSYTLDENPTTGYTWAYKIADENVLTYVSDKYTASNSDKAGAGGTHVYEFAGVKKGETSIEFTLKRDWEGGETASTKTVNVVVGEDLNVKEVK